MEVDNNDVEPKVAVESVQVNDSNKDDKPVENDKPVEESKPAEDNKTESADEVKVADEAKVADEVNKSDEAKIADKVEVTEETKKIDEAKTVDDEEKTKETENVTPELLEKIKKQVEFYFGDINMHRDKFMIEQTQLDEGWIPMSVMLNFKMLASMSKNPDTIIKSIETSELMDVSDCKKKIRRKPSKPLPVYDDEYKKAQAARTVYVKGFPLQDIYIHTLKDFFKDFEPFENIVLRRFQDHKDKKLKFKGSVFIQFETLDGAKAFMARESVKYGDEELIRKFSEDYSVEKAKEKEERKLKGDTKGKKSAKKENGDAETEDSTETFTLPKGSVLHFTGVSDTTDWEDIKKSLSELGAEIAYVAFKIGDIDGQIRLFGENAAKPLLEKMTDNKLKINDTEVTFRILEGDEEEEYLKSVQNTMANKKHKTFKGGKRGRPKKGRGGAQRGRKRNASPHREAGAAKKVAISQE